MGHAPPSESILPLNGSGETLVIPDLCVEMRLNRLDAESRQIARFTWSFS